MCGARRREGYIGLVFFWGGESRSLFFPENTGWPCRVSHPQLGGGSAKQENTRPISCKIRNHTALRGKGTRTDARLFKLVYVSMARAKEHPKKNERRQPAESSNFGVVRFEAGAQRAHENNRNPIFKHHQARLHAPTQPHRRWSWPSLRSCACRF